MVKVVILGAGYGGAQCARTLQKVFGKDLEMIIIEKRTYSVHKMAAARASALGDKFASRALIPNDSLISPGRGTMMHETIKKVTEQNVLLGNGQVIDFDYLVCATGALNFSIAEPPLKYSTEDKMKEFYSKVSGKIAFAKRIVIVGGGPVGVELAAEIKFAYPEKDVSIVHSGETLLNRVRPPPGRKFYKMVEDRLHELGVKILLEQKLDLDDEEYRDKPYIAKENQTYKTQIDSDVTADLLLVCTGKTLSNSFYPETWRNPSAKGALAVTKSLNLVEHNNIFAIGDLNDVAENKQGAFAAKQGELVANNIKLQIRGKKMKMYKPGFGTGKTFMMVSIGRKKGVSFMGYLTLGSNFTARTKSRDLFVKMYWELFNINKKLIPPENEIRSAIASDTPIKDADAIPLSRYSNVSEHSNSFGAIAQGSLNWMNMNIDTNLTINSLPAPPPGDLPGKDRKEAEAKALKTKSNFNMSKLAIPDGSSLTELDPEKTMLTNVSKPNLNRHDMISFVGSGRGISTNANAGSLQSADAKPQLKNVTVVPPTPSSFFMPMSDEELNKSRRNQGNSKLIKIEELASSTDMTESTRTRVKKHRKKAKRNTKQTMESLPAGSRSTPDDDTENSFLFPVNTLTNTQTSVDDVPAPIIKGPAINRSEMVSFIGNGSSVPMEGILQMQPSNVKKSESNADVRMLVGPSPAASIFMPMSEEELNKSRKQNGSVYTSNTKNGSASKVAPPGLQTMVEEPVEPDGESI